MTRSIFLIYLFVFVILSVFTNAAMPEEAIAKEKAEELHSLKGKKY